MKVLVSIVFSLFCFIGNAQKRYFEGKVFANSIPMAQVEIININLKTVVKTDRLGNFTIPVQQNDELIIHREGFEDVVYKVDLNENDENEFQLTQIDKKIEEIIIEKKAIDLNYSYERQYVEKVKLFPDGAIENGIDFVELSKILKKKIKKDKMASRDF